LSVTLYSQPNCNPCNQTKKWLAKNNIDFEIKDITEDRDAFDTIIALGFTGTPVVVTENDSWQGTDIAKLKKIKSEAS